MGAADLVPWSFAGAFLCRVGFDRDRLAGEPGFEIGDRHPHRFGSAGREDQRVAGFHFEQDGGAPFSQFDYRRELLQAPSGQATPRNRLAAHSDLVEGRLDLMKWQRSGFG